MNYSEAKQQFVESWGKLAIQWGENRTIGQVHGLLLVAHTPLCADEIMNELQISRGNANSTLRHLIDLGIVFKHHKAGDRKDFFTAEKDMWKVMKEVIRFRKKKELDPMVQVLNQISSVNPTCEKSKEFCKTINEISEFSAKADQMLDKLSNSEMNWLLRSMLGVRR